MGSSSVLSAVAKRLQGKVALITGGAGGIGMATAKLFASHGAHLVIADIDDEKGQALCNTLGTKTTSFVHCDVTSEPDIKAAIDVAVSLHDKLDILFSNAGILDMSDKHIIDAEKTAFEAVMATNLIGSFLATKHAARAMVPAKSGSIVINASTASAIGGLLPYSYTCSKHALVGLMRNAAAELGKYGIRVNCVSPHAVPTAMPMGALGIDEEGVEEFAERSGNLKGVRLKAKDVAEAVLYLGSDEGRYVSGLNLLVDGGFTVVKEF